MGVCPHRVELSFLLVRQCREALLSCSLAFQVGIFSLKTDPASENRNLDDEFNRICLLRLDCSVHMQPHILMKPTMLLFMALSSVVRK